MDKGENNLLTFGGHLEVLRKMLFRIIGVASAIAMVVFCCKDTTFDYWPLANMIFVHIVGLSVAYNHWEVISISKNITWI